MDKITRQFDGTVKTPSGDFAVVPRRPSAAREGVSWFEFRTTFYAEPVRIEWPTASPIALIPAQDGDVARIMVSMNFGSWPTDAQIENFNVAVDAYQAEPAPEPAPAKRGRKPGRPAKDAEDTPVD